ncbi:cysteine methyltransferase [Candidatus Woesearchaeota archaeon B3_Woes]|nr:MAG: cysteine methyltransferase [Candidatus Woesearchaeota archaeon B3_Woes]
MGGFNERVWKIVSKVPRGRVTTYKAVAEKLGTKAYRAVGNAMNKNPYSPKVPCHRVVKSNGEVGGFASGTKKKVQMLKKEGIEIKNNKIKKFNQKLFIGFNLFKCLCLASF